MAEWERGLGRHKQFDERSRSFPIRPLLEDRKPRSYTWRLMGGVLDQGAEGACVGFAWAHELAARPSVTLQTYQQARAIYFAAQRIDPWPGGAYEPRDPDEPFYEGTSVLAGAKICRDAGYFETYRWAFGVDDLRLAVGYAGPAVVGIDWHTGMWSPDEEGYLHPVGAVVGGHAVLVRGYSVKARRFLIQNSWGPSWGRDGTAFIDYDDMGELLARNGEAVIPQKRKRP